MYLYSSYGIYQKCSVAKILSPAENMQIALIFFITTTNREYNKTNKSILITKKSRIDGKFIELVRLIQICY